MWLILQLSCAVALAEGGWTLGRYLHRRRAEAIAGARAAEEERTRGEALEVGRAYVAGAVTALRASQGTQGPTEADAMAGALARMGLQDGACLLTQTALTGTPYRVVVRRFGVQWSEALEAPQVDCRLEAEAVQGGAAQG